MIFCSDGSALNTARNGLFEQRCGLGALVDDALGAAPLPLGADVVALPLGAGFVALPLGAGFVALLDFGFDGLLLDFGFVALPLGLVSSRWDAACGDSAPLVFGDVEPDAV